MCQNMYQKKPHKSLLPVLLLIFLCLVYSKSMTDHCVIEFMEILRGLIKSYNLCHALYTI